MGHTTAVSPFAPATPAILPPLSGVRLGTAAAGIRYTGRDDLVLMAFDAPAAIAGVFTLSTVVGAPVAWCREVLPGGRARAILVNAGNANVFTGAQGHQVCAASAEAIADRLNCPPEQVFLASTGVIGEPLPVDRLIGGLAPAQAALAPDGWAAAAAAIMTTDTFPKLATTTVTLDGVSVTLNGIAKGSGMIAPDMATMLAFLATDAAVAPPVLQAMLTRAVVPSFNSITVDSDTSTSDTVLLAATGTTPMDPIETPEDPRAAPLQEAITRLCTDLARQVIADGEGISKLITVRVQGAADDGSARRIARAIADSPLVKTAVAGEDANWGRVAMAVGKCREPIALDRLTIAFGGVPVALAGARAPDLSEDRMAEIMRRPEVEIAVDVGVGSGVATVWGCDLTHGYIDINGSYRS